MQKTVAFHTVGCKLNFAETNAIGEDFLRRGYEIVDFNQNADVYVINTCSVTENAERECRQIVRRALRQNPNAFVAVTGCYAQLRPQELANIKGVDVVLGAGEKFDLFNKFDTLEKQNLSCVFVSPIEEANDFHPAFSTEANSRTRAFLKIQDGCDYTCTYCTIPKARGKSRSMHPEELIREFKALVDFGYKEIILTGVNVGEYGRKIGTNLYKVLTQLVNLHGDFRIRISSIEPNLLNDDILKLTAKNEKLCNHFHIPLQSGSDNVLKLMQRRYNSSYYKDLIYKVKEIVPNVGIGVDVIVGTPGETEKDFQITYDFLNELPISYLHVFTYSERPGTKALEIKEKVPIRERKIRNKILRELSDKKKESFYRSMLGKEVNVLFEEQNKEGLIKGFSSNYVRVKHPFNSALVNKFVNVKITDAEENICSAKPVIIKKENLATVNL
jgi:threonylcarbamoyladenosine tRNA methylthiotransferase MtaB